MTRRPCAKRGVARFLAVLVLSLPAEVPLGAKASRAAPMAEGAPEPVLLSVRAAQVLLPRQGPSGAIQLWADFAATPPEPGDVISVSVAGSLLFSAPFSSFASLDHPQTYVLIGNGLLAWFDFGGWELRIMASWVALPPLDPVDGFVVELRIGEGRGQDRVDLRPKGEHLLLFQRSRTAPAP